MIRDAMLFLAEMLFWFTGGELLINTVWIVVWVVGGTVLLLIPYYFAITVGGNRSQSLPAIVFLVSFFPLLMAIVGPPIVQGQMVSECRDLTAELTADGETVEVPVTQCRNKKNFYDTEYGEWKTVQHSG